MTSKILLSIAAAAATLMPLAAWGQIAPEKRPATASSAPAYKYEAYAGFAYTGINQVTQSRHGLMGGELALTRDLTRHFGITADGAYYRVPVGSDNPGSPTVISIAAGPELRSTLYGNVDGFVHVLMGGEHTGGEGMSPNVSFTVGFGGGLVYNLSQRWALRASGDRMSDSFTVSNPPDGASPHTHYNGRATIGVVYRF